MKWKFVAGAAVVVSLLLPRAPLGLHIVESKLAERVQEALGKTHLISYVDSTSNIDYVAGTISSEYILRDQSSNTYTIASITRVGLSELNLFAKAFLTDGENSIIDVSTDEIYADAIAKADIFTGELIADVELTPFAFRGSDDISITVPQSKIIVENDGKTNQVTVAIPNSIVMSVSGAPVVIEDVVSQFETHNGELINRIKVDNVSLGSQPLARNLESIKSITLVGDKIDTDLTLTADYMGSYSNINANLNLANWRSENLIDMLDSVTKFNGTHNAENQLQLLNTLVGLAGDGASLSLKVPGVESAYGISSIDLSLGYPEYNGVTRDNALSLLDNLTGSLTLDTTLNDIQQFVPIMFLQHLASNSFIHFDSETNRIRSEVTLANSIATINGQQISL